MNVKKCFIVTSFQAWDDANRAEDVQMHGPDLDLEAEGLTSRERDDLLQVEHLVDSDETTGEDDNGYSDMVDMAVDEFLARAKRSETEARLARRLEEQLSGDIALGYAGLSPIARDQMVKMLQGRLDGIPEALDRQRAELRRKAAELAPHNLTEVIGEPTARGRS